MQRNQKKFLIVRRDNIGDLVCTTPAFAALRRHYPAAQIAALVNSYNVEVLRGNPNVDRIFVYQKLKHVGGLIGRARALVKRIYLILQIRSWGPDTIILAKSGYDRHGMNFARLLGTKRTIGFVPDDLGCAGALPDIKCQTPDFATLHEVGAVNELLGALSIKDALGKLNVYPDREAVTQLKKWLPDAASRIAVHISARESERRWGQHNFVELIRHILDQYNQVQILLFWSPGTHDDPQHPGDDAVATSIIKLVNCNRLIPMSTHNLKELIAGLSVCNLFIGADGGAMHLAVALDKKVLALFENQPSKLNHWCPWQATSSHVIHSESEDHPEVAYIAQPIVREALQKLMME